ncbi:protease inhibitors-like [Photinus pyralis]|uniref:protease inhibitors-like n=1 Tax=Photinus pyralis TaxID=7054 RepID=UPI001266F5B0|nr:protease inhibitors-like [Photinus pyralis]XP_031357639.1 protease inhibitors-like [Photinus pyralis]
MCSTMKLQLIFFIAILIVYVSAEWACNSGVSYRENDCNYCNCLDGGLACTRMRCGHQESLRMASCTDYGKVTTSRYGETCTCTRKYHTVCWNQTSS